MIGESATSISSLPAQPARRMISAQPLRLQAAPTGCPSTRTWRPSPLVSGQTITERSAIRQASPAVTPRASGRSPRCLTGRCAVPGGVLVRLNARTKVALDTFTQAAEGRRDLINAARARGTSGKAGRAPPRRPPGERQRPAVRSPRRRSLTARQTGSRAGHRATVGRAPPTRDIPPRCATESRSEHGAAPEAQGGPTTPWPKGEPRPALIVGGAAGSRPARASGRPRRGLQMLRGATAAAGFGPPGLERCSSRSGPVGAWDSRASQCRGRRAEGRAGCRGWGRPRAPSPGWQWRPGEPRSGH